MTDLSVFDVDATLRDRLRDEFDAVAVLLPDIYAALTWPQKAMLLSAIIDAGDHPTGYNISYQGLPRKSAS